MESTDKEGQRGQTGLPLSGPHARLVTLLIHGLRRTEAQNQEDRGGGWGGSGPDGPISSVRCGHCSTYELKQTNTSCQTSH